MSSTSNATEKNRVAIVGAIDQTSASDPVVQMAAALAIQIAGAELHLVNVVELVPYPAGPVVPPPSAGTREARAHLDKVVAEVRERYPALHVVGHLGLGSPVPIILELAGDLEADLIVVGTHGKNRFEKLVLGSVSEGVAKKALCPVLLARPKSYPESPAIEPPCADCVAVQKATNNEKLWCERHSGHHVHGRTHYESPSPFAMGSMLIRPQG